MYNLTNITDTSNNLYDIVKNTNDLSGGLYFSLMVVALFIVYLVVFKKQNFKEVFIAASFFMVIVSTLLWVAKLVSYQFLILPVIMFLAAIIIYMINMGY